MIPNIKTEFYWNPVEQIYRDSQMPNMDSQSVYSPLSSPPGYSPVSSMESQTLPMQVPFGAGSPQQAVYRPDLPENQENYVLTPVLGDAPEFNVISRAAASIMQYAKTEALGHILYLEKNKHTTIEIKSDTIQSGDIIAFNFSYENPYSHHSSADDQLKALTLQTRHPDLMSKCSCSESQGFVTITGDHGYQEYGGNGEKFVLNEYLVGNTMQLKLSFKHNTACFKPFIIDRMSNRGISPVVQMKIQVHDANMNPRTLAQNVTIKVGSNVKREFEKHLGLNYPVTRARSRRASGLRPLKTLDVKNGKNNFSRNKLVLKKQGHGSVLYIPGGEAWKFFEILCVKLGADMVNEE
ncbi:unnamed protein product [Oikopleura dioica]|uniref:Uncharacterized protein n=1 Tax=Oikopleura dioica TaxID=34765 RepID=E4XPJ6_OIKDI|nr:unnamed protein product [Oikopleura dioica]